MVRLSAAHTRASAGTVTLAPTSVITPSRITMVPRSITCPGAVMMRAPTIAWTRGVAAQPTEAKSNELEKASARLARRRARRGFEESIRRLLCRGGDSGSRGKGHYAAGFAGGQPQPERACRNRVRV